MHVAARLGRPAAAANWAVPIKTGSSGEAQAQAAPSAPGGVSAACVSPSEREVLVSWNAVANASTYTVYKSTTTSTGTCSSTATGVTTTSWASGTLAAGNVYFKVAAYVGTKWVGVESSPAGETTFTTTGTECTQP
ncbi:MAG: hypothetical protein ABSD85_07485 [Acidimicrobiales bacterium]|jgi:hypothetical protein